MFSEEKNLHSKENRLKILEQAVSLQLERTFCTFLQN